MYTKSHDSEHMCGRQRGCLPGVRMQHPLAGTAVLTPDSLRRIDGAVTSLYTILKIKNRRRGTLPCYGHKGCDFSHASLLFFRPGERISLNTATYAEEACIVAFAKELAAGSGMESDMEGYTFFGYRTDEALHVSECEEHTLDRLFHDITAELETCIDDYSCKIIGRRIGMMLDYCGRFYNRQFIMRADSNRKTVRHARHVIHDFFTKEADRHGDMPQADYIAARTGTSEAYLKDIIRKETGLSVGRYTEMIRLDMARDMLMHSHKTDGEIASVLNFGSVRCFRLFFSRTTGMTTEECRTSS